MADNYVEMVATTALGDIRLQPWLRAAMDVFADAVGGLGPVLDVGCGPGTVTAYLAERGLDVSGVDILPQVLSSFAGALVPGGQLIIAMHVGNGDMLRTEAYGGVPVHWTTSLWQPDQLVSLVEQAGLQPTAELRLLADGQIGPGVVLVAEA